MAKTKKNKKGGVTVSVKCKDVKLSTTDISRRLTCLMISENKVGAPKASINRLVKKIVKDAKDDATNITGEFF